MNATIESIHKDLIAIKRDVSFIKHALEEDLELSDAAVDALSEARSALDSDYVNV